MTAADHLTTPGESLLQCRTAASLWDPAFADAMASRGVAVHEVPILDSLLAAWVTEYAAVADHGIRSGPPHVPPVAQTNDEERP